MSTLRWPAFALALALLTPPMIGGAVAAPLAASERDARPPAGAATPDDATVAADARQYAAREAASPAAADYRGGASVVLAEGVGSFLAVVLAGPGRAAVGVDINATHHRPATAGWVTAVARPISVGRTTACLEIVITDDQGRRTCTCRFTAALRDAPPVRRTG